MNRIYVTSLAGLSALSIAAGMSSCSGTGDKTHNGAKPNIIFILADDLGYGDLGCFGQEKIETPNIDKLAAEGMRFTNFYSGSPVCAPTRCVLLTGMHSGKSQVRGNDEWGERGNVWDYRSMLADSSLEGQRPIAAGTTTIGTLMQSVGYKTAIVGKWGLGAPHTDGVPNKQGFDFFYGYNCQRMAHTYYPTHLWKNDKKDHLNNDTIPPHMPLPEGADPYDVNSYGAYQLNTYAPTAMFEEMSQWVEENKSNPFFLYWASIIPHLPLQAPQRWIDHYVAKFGDEEPHLGSARRGNYYPARYPKATYAAMISYFDEQVGKLVQQLKDLGLYENTLIILTSDNGPIGGYAPWFKSAGPFRDTQGFVKGSIYEGGIRVPMIAAWPGVIKPGTVSDHAAAVYDVMPTLGAVAGYETPAEATGLSFYPALKGKKQKPAEFLYWEYPAGEGSLAIRMGTLKAVKKKLKGEGSAWELYDVAADPKEETDLAPSMPEVIAKAEEILLREHTCSSNPAWQFESLGD
jgi:arylsulfatase